MKDIIEFIREVDFSQYSESGQKITTKHYLHGVINELIENLSDYGSGLIFSNEKFYYYNGKFWEVIPEKELMINMVTVANYCGMPIVEASNHRFQKELLEQLKLTTYTELKLKKKTTYLNFLNGTYKFEEEGSYLAGHRKEDMLTYVLPYEFDYDAECPKFEKFLSEVLPDEEKKTILLEYLGSLFDRSIKLEKMLICHGKGRNGKGVLFDIINALIGSDNITNYPLDKLTDAVGAYRAQIEGKVLNICSEMKKRFDVDLMKTMVSGEPLDAKALYKNPITIHNYAKLIFSTNKLPESVESTLGFTRRFLILPFDVTVGPEQLNTTLANEIIEDELPGIMNLVIWGYERIRKQKSFSKCEACEKVLNQFVRSVNHIEVFINDNYEESKTHYTTLNDLYTAYLKFSESKGYKPYGKNSFSRTVKEELGITQTRLKVGMVFKVTQKSPPSQLSNPSRRRRRISTQSD